MATPSPARKKESARPLLTLAASEARKEWADTLNRVIYLDQCIALTRRGKVVALLLPAERNTAA